MRIEADAGGIVSSSGPVARAGETFAGMSEAVQLASGDAAGVAGTDHATAGIEEFGVFWTAYLRVLGIGAEQAHAGLTAAGRSYTTVERDVARGAARRGPQ